jgi:hydrogenase maturation protease
MRNNKTIGILGLGNLLLRDEGFGAHFIAYLNELYQVPDHVTVLDGGTAGIMMAPFIESSDILYVIDTVALDAEPGSIHIFSDADVNGSASHARMSPHQVGLLDILDLCRLRERAPEKTVMIAVVPHELRMSIDLSPKIEKKLPEIMSILIDFLAEHQTVLQPRTPLPCA